MLLTDCLRRAAQELDSDSDVIVVPDPSKQGTKRPRMMAPEIGQPGPSTSKKASGDLFERGEELARKIRKRKLGKVQSATKPACAKHQVGRSVPVK